MSAPAAPAIDLAARVRLFAPGERVGWVFRDRQQFIQHFREPQPVPQPIPYSLLLAEDAAKKRHRKVIDLATKISLGVLGLFVLLAGCSAIAASTSSSSVVILLITGIVVAGLIAGTIIGISASQCTQANKAVRIAGEQLTAQHAQAEAGWQHRRSNHYRAEKTRIDQLDEWGAAQTPHGTRRLDIFGGNLWAWQAFLTVYGTSVLPHRPLIVLDLSKEMVCDELALLAQAAGVPIDAQMLPEQLAQTSVLSGLPAQQLVDALIESMYGDNPTASRADRSIDDRILSTLCQALGADLSLGRIAAGLRALMDQPDNSGYLTAQERNHITDELFSADYRHQAADTLRRLESYIHPMEKLGTECVDNGPSYLTCMALSSDANNVRAELLTDIMVQWLTHRIVTQNTDIPEVIIAGADAIALRHLERLSDACERRNIRLTLMFRNLRETGVNFIGRGVTGFMRIGNSTEATQAADHIGRHYKFVISQITKTLGGNETHTDTRTHGEAETEGTSISDSIGWSTNWNKGTSTTHRAGHIFGADRSDSSSHGGSRSHTRTEGHSWSKTRNWSTARAFAEGTNWTEAQMHQRVQEYAVEPTDLQALPEHAMILVKPRPGSTPVLVPVEFDPAIITLPRVSTDPLPEPAQIAPAQQNPGLPTAHTTPVAYHHTGSFPTPYYPAPPPAPWGQPAGQPPHVPPGGWPPPRN